MGPGRARWGCCAGSGGQALPPAWAQPPRSPTPVELQHFPREPEASFPGGVPRCPPADGALWESGQEGRAQGDLGRLVPHLQLAAKPSASLFCDTPPPRAVALHSFRVLASAKRQCLPWPVCQAGCCQPRGWHRARAPRWHCSVVPVCTSCLEAAEERRRLRGAGFPPGTGTWRGRVGAPAVGHPGAMCAGCEARWVPCARGQVPPLPLVTGETPGRTGGSCSPAHRGTASLLTALQLTTLHVPSPLQRGFLTNKSS